MRAAGPSRLDQAGGIVAALILALGAQAVVLAVVPSAIFDLDRFTVPKELALLAAAALAGVIGLLRTDRIEFGIAEILLAGFTIFSAASAAAPIPADHPPEHDLPGACFDRLFVEPAPHAGIVAGFECRRDLGPFRTVPQGIGARAPAERQHDRVHDDRLPGAGFAGEGRESARELEFGRVDDGEIADLKMREHGQYSSPPERPLRPQCSFDRSRRK